MSDVAPSEANSIQGILFFPRLSAYPRWADNSFILLSLLLVAKTVHVADFPGLGYVRVPILSGEWYKESPGGLWVFAFLLLLLFLELITTFNGQ